MHKIISQQPQEISETLPKNVYWIHYHLKAYQNCPVDGSVFLKLGLPIPTTITYFNRGSVAYAWAIDGYFAKEKAQQYIRDVKDKITALFAWEGLEYQDISFKAPELSQSVRFTDIVYKLKSFSEIEDKRRSTIDRKWKTELSHALKLNGKKSLIDEVFESSRKEIYALKRDNALNYENVFAILDNNNKTFFNNKCSRSDIKCKAKNMLEWTEKNYRVGRGERKKSTKTQEEITMTRQESIKVARDIKTAKAKAKVLMIAEMLKLQDKLLKKNGQPKASLVAEMAQISRPTTMKYLEEGGYYN